MHTCKLCIVLLSIKNSTDVDIQEAVIALKAVCFHLNL